MRALPRKLFLILALVAGFVQGEPCNSATDCTGCYQVSGCKWCLDEDEEFPGISKGCMKNTIDCSKVIEPRWKEPEPDKHPQEHLSNKEIKVTVAPHNTSKIQFSAQLTKNPFDLYFLMDFTSSMKDHVDNMVEISEDLGVDVPKYAEDYTVGFGSYVEKCIPPFAMHHTYYKDENRPYAFRHHMELTKNGFAKFKTELGKNKKKYFDENKLRNFDEPEDGLDGLMQVAVCKDEIGWRNNSLKMVVLITGSGLHFAYDGQLAGVIIPNDMKCHLKEPEKREEQEYYSHYYEEWYEREMDYPSFGQVRFKLEENNIKTVFAVTPAVEGLYKQISSFFGKQSSSSKAALKKGGDGKEKLKNEIKEQYKNFASKMIIEIENHNEIADLKSDTCEGGKKDRTQELGYVCPNATIDKKETFTLTINPLYEKCQEYKTPKDITIKLKGFSEELNVKVSCPGCKDQCTTEDTNKSTAQKRKICNDHGELKCGACKCDPDYSGKLCKCHKDDDDDEKCRKDGQVCSGHGKCNCGACKCTNERYIGDFCEYEKADCPKFDGKVCNGHGTCQFNATVNSLECNCNNGWRGDQCQCRDVEKKESCQGQRLNAKECSDQGTCMCVSKEGWKCQCNPGKTGKYCHIHGDSKESLTKNICNMMWPCIQEELGLKVEDGSSCNKTTETLEEWMKPKIVAACNITQPDDPRGIVYVKSPIDKVEEKCTEAKTKCAKRTGNTRQTNRAIAENDYEEGSDGSNEEDNEVTGTMDSCLSDIETKDMTVLKSLCTDPLLHEDCQIKVKFLGDRGFKKFLDDDEFGKLTEGSDLNTQLLVVFNEKEHDSEDGKKWTFESNCVPFPLGIYVGGSLAGAALLVAIGFLTFCIYQTRKNQEEIDKYIAEIERNNRIIKENDDIMKELEMIEYNSPLYQPKAHITCALYQPKSQPPKRTSIENENFSPGDIPLITFSR